MVAHATIGNAEWQSISVVSKDKKTHGSEINTSICNLGNGALVSRYCCCDKRDVVRLVDWTTPNCLLVCVVTEVNGLVIARVNKLHCEGLCECHVGQVMILYCV